MGLGKRMKKDIRIAISGRSGCGNTTVSKILADVLGLRFINFTFRSLAEERGVDFLTILEQSEKNDLIDKEVDKRQIQLARDSDGCVLGSRLAVWMLEDADLKVYLKACPQTRAERIAKREGGDLEKVAAFTANRDKQDHERYMRIYGINNDDYGFVDLIIDTNNLTPPQIADLVIARIKSI